MSATEMVLHCNKVHLQLLEPAVPSGKGTTPRQYLFRWLILYLMPRFPRNAKAPKGLRTKGLAGNAEFRQEKESFISILRRFANLEQPIRHHHPYFGNLSTREWGRTTWKHLDHHLRQFGV
jgi:hypothetical protein